MSQAEMMKERPKLDLATRTVTLRPVLERQYALYRDALRQPAK